MDFVKDLKSLVPTIFMVFGINLGAYAMSGHALTSVVLVAGFAGGILSAFIGRRLIHE